MDKQKRRKGALVFKTQQGKDQLMGYRMEIGGKLGIAYIKGDEVIAFKPIDVFLEEFYSGMFLTLNDLTGLDQPVRSAGQR